MSVFARGGCACQAYRYVLPERSVPGCGCCCTDCSTWTGAPYVVWMGMRPETVVLQDSPPPERRTSVLSSRGHCPFCGTAMTFRRVGLEAHRDALFCLTAATLDDSSLVAPTEAVYCDRRPPWFELPDDFPRHPGRAPGYDTLERHGKLPMQAH